MSRTAKSLSMRRRGSALTFGRMASSSPIARREPGGTIASGETSSKRASAGGAGSESSASDDATAATADRREDWPVGRMLVVLDTGRWTDGRRSDAVGEGLAVDKSENGEV